MTKDKKAKSNSSDSNGKKDEFNKNKTINSKNAEIEELKKALEDSEDAKLRALAETENIRRRMDKEKQDNARYGTVPLAKDLLSVLDNFERALLASPKETKNKNDLEKNYNSLHEGVSLTLKEIISIFNRNGIEIINPEKGETFDHNIHQAMLEVVTDEFKPGSVCEVLQPGYKIYDRLLRPAMVGVSKEKKEN
ncbi:MAG: nucleotide exchange factor GrpE [Rickettsiales bacterium]|nr:nucleotide exchange factor GrpE [Rickettsiales bacterium]|tara:strand:+ start:6114 stop:6695 length:582 start_codon:yes stop_codon:yes gene_type:complete